MNKLKVLVAICFLSFATIASAKDVLKLDVAGVKLGMSPSEVVAALKAKYKVADSKIKRLKFGGSPYIKGNFISTVELKNANTTVRVNFGVVPPVNKLKPIKAENIKYTVAFTNENVAKLKKAVIAKYGKPTANQKTSATLEWCTKAEDVMSFMGTTKGCSGMKPYLRLNLTRLQLFDPTRNLARAKYKLKGKSANPIL